MNFATALDMPSWKAEFQHFSYQVIRYTPIVFMAFSKAFAPRIFETFKGLSHYYIQCGEVAGQWAMNAAGIEHNPLQAAVRSSYAELTSAEAEATYARLNLLTRETVMDGIVLGLCGVVAIASGIELATTAYRKGVALYEYLHNRFAPPTPEPVILPTVALALASISERPQSDETVKALTEEVQNERRFIAQLDLLDATALDDIRGKVDDADSGCEAFAQITADHLKTARAALALRMEGDRIAQAQLAYTVDQAIALARTAVGQPVSQPGDELAALLDVPGAKGSKRGTSRSKRTTQTKTGAGRTLGEKRSRKAVDA
ncbi:MAG: hypothetical protein WCD18_10230 [Thermosynechococcaceae cyanobacterium]